MKSVREVIRRLPVWVNPEHTAESAIVLMRGHDIGALPVLDGNHLVGMVTYSHLLGIDPRRKVGEVMMVGVPIVHPSMTIREAADIMAQAGIGRLPVIDEDRLIGVITTSDLLPELGRSFDPLTGLPWMDTVRRWGITRLQSGSEISVLFVDIDNFGQFNKRHGHIVGDEVLQGVADVLSAAIDSEIEMLCRFGGDEFCIVSLRNAQEAEELASRIARKVSEIDIPSLSGSGVTCAVGLWGGKRTKEREHVHYAATFNNLVNLASRDCTAKKGIVLVDAPTKEVQALLAPKPASRLKLSKVEVDYDGENARVHINLQLGDEENPAGNSQGRLLLEGLTFYPASASATTDSNGVVRLVAETTLSAVRGLLPQGYNVVLSEVFFTNTGKGQRLVTVVGEWICDRQKRTLVGTAVVGEDPYRATASAVLSAVNRPLGPFLNKL